MIHENSCNLCLKFYNMIMRLTFVFHRTSGRFRSLHSEYANPQPHNTCMNVTGISNGKISCLSYAEVKDGNTDFAESAQIKKCYQESGKSALFYRQDETCGLKEDSEQC